MDLCHAVVLFCLAAATSAITVEHFYPFDPVQDERLLSGDLESSPKISLSVPSKFYDREYNYLWVHTDGFVSFEPGRPSKDADFPFSEALLAPYMADLDTTDQGAVYYRESHDRAVLVRADADVRRAFPRAAAAFDAESVFIVTWHDVVGQSLEGETGTFTFQAILISNGRDSYAIFLYPENNMGLMQKGVKHKTSVFEARAGFNLGLDKYMEMYPVDKLVNYKNTARAGEWIFQMGGEGVQRGEVEDVAERARIVRRQTTLVNIQEVDLMEEVEPERGNPPRAYDYCARDASACPVANSVCVSHDNGFCCKCQPGFYGNGKICVAADVDATVSGNVTGTVDVRGADGSIERLSVTDTDYHSYVIMSTGRAHSAMSVGSATLGRALQPIPAIGEIIGWMFASPSSPAANGFQYTGGRLQRRTSIRFRNSDYRFDMRQRFVGATERDGQNVLSVTTNFVGMLPAVPDQQQVQMQNFAEEFRHEAPGRITSSSSRTYTVGGETYTYDIEQTLIFSECSSSLQNVPGLLKLTMSDIFIAYSEDDDNVRYAMDASVSSTSGGVEPTEVPQDPCRNNRCSRDATCEAVGTTDHVCRCRDGFAGNGYTCDDFDECVNNPCPPNSVCENNRGSFQCRCQEGFYMGPDGSSCLQVPDYYNPEAGNPCDVRGRCGNAYCRELGGDSYECTCPPQYYLNAEENDCLPGVPTSEPSNPCDMPGVCGRAYCRNLGDGASMCECPGGFELVDNSDCIDVDECAGRGQCGANAVCENTDGSFQCNCDRGFRYSEDADGCVADRVERTECQRRYDAVVEMIRNNPRLQDTVPPSCMPDGTFAPRQCLSFSGDCWCVDTVTGDVISGTVTEPRNLANLDCDNPFGVEDTSDLTQCQRDVRQANQASSAGFRPQCTEAGAYEPLQRHPDGFYMCVDFNGVEVSRSTTLPQCVERTECQRQYNEVEETIRNNPGLQDGPEHPTCMPDGTFAPRQCLSFTGACWCVDTVTGDVISGTVTEPWNGENLDCDNPFGVEDTSDLTQCQRDVRQANQASSAGFRPQCTDSGAYEPLQRHPDGFYMCVDFNGVEVSRSTTLPQCLSACRLEAYYAETENIFTESLRFVPQCEQNGDYSRFQCDYEASSCYCVNGEGEEIVGSRVVVQNLDDVDFNSTQCGAELPSRIQDQEPNPPSQLIFAQAMGLHAVDIPLTAGSVARRLHVGAGRRMLVGVAVDCSTGTVFWSDVSSRVIMKAPLRNFNAKQTVTRTALRSPEGLAVDYVSGNVYWTDSGTDRIEMARTDGSNRMVVVKTGLVNPRGIAVDPFRGKMYWSDWNRKDPKIMVANMDGSDIQVFISQGLKLPNDIIIDQFYRRICFADAGTKKIECMNLDGSDRRVVHDLTDASSTSPKLPFGLAADGKYMYYSDRRAGRLHAIDILTGEDIDIRGPVGVHGHMFGVALAYNQCPNGYNACSDNNGGCSHVCAPTPFGRSCRCPEGAEGCVERSDNPQ